MDSYSHGAFDISGIVVRVENPESELTTIMAAWDRFYGEGIEGKITDKTYPWVHAVYYNYQNPTDPDRKSYDMLIGYMTDEGVVQENSEITTLNIPAQEYRYTTITEWVPEIIGSEWSKINSMTEVVLPRTYGYDLDMYDETGKQVTIAVSV